MKNVMVSESQLSDILGKTVALVSETGQRLEKVSQYEDELVKFAAHATGRLVRAGLVAETSATEFELAIADGGFSKVAEAFDFVIDNLNDTTMGKAASASLTQEEALTSDQIWDEAFGAGS